MTTSTKTKSASTNQPAKSTAKSGEAKAKATPATKTTTSKDEVANTKDTKTTSASKSTTKTATKSATKDTPPKDEVAKTKATKATSASKSTTKTATKIATKATTSKDEVAKTKATKDTSASKSSAKNAIQATTDSKDAGAKSKTGAAKAKDKSAGKVVKQAEGKARGKAAGKAGGKAKVVTVYAQPSEGIEEQFKDITLLNEHERYEVMRLLQEQNPNPKSELNFNNTFELLCAVVLSAQATDESVNKATPALFKVAPDPKSMAALGAQGIAPYIQSIGLWNNKAKFLAQLSEALLQKHGGQVPSTYEELVALPGVGSKTAKVVLNVAFGQPFIAVDTHVFRVASRSGLCIGKCPGQVEERIGPLVAETFLKDAHHYLLLHGRYNCTAQRFEDHCSKCVIAKYCKHNYAPKSSQ